MEGDKLNEQEAEVAKGELVEIKNTTSQKVDNRGDLTPFFNGSDNSVNRLYQTEVPKICKDEPCQLGVDEAGRGPVLGPMVYGIAFAPLSRKDLLVDLGCADSKTLTEEQRNKIFDEICNKKEEIGWAIEAISPNVISNSMYGRCSTSLNVVSMNAAVGLIKRAIDAGVNVEEIYVDTVGKPEKYQAMLESVFPEIKKIVVAKKADSTYPIVSAASICAKVSRDYALEGWKFQESDVEGKYGSGYPGDPVTKQWLASNIDPIFGFPQLVRFNWSTAQLIIDKNAVEVEWEDNEDKTPSKNRKISMFFTKSINGCGEPQKKKHHFFVDRCLSNTVDL